MIDRENIHAKCFVCGMEISGRNLYKRGDKYYCHGDYERTSPKELQKAIKAKREKAWWDRLPTT